MGTYDAKFHAYEQAIKKDPAWAKMTKQQRAEQLGRYSVGLQRDAEKAAKKAAGKELAKELAMERKDKIKMYEGLFDQIDKHNEKQKMYEKLWDQLDNKASGNKFLDFLKNNKKTFLIGAGIAAVIGVGAWLWNKFGDEKADETQNRGVVKEDDATPIAPADSTVLPADSTRVVPGVVPGVVPDSLANDSTKVVPGVVPGVVPDSLANDSTKVVPVAPADSTVVAADSTKVVSGVTPVAPADSTDKTAPADEAKATDKTDEASKDEANEAVKINTSNGKYIVKKCDNIWNIAKKQLADELGRRPLNREICERRDEIMALNPNLKYEADNYTVLIYPKQELNIAS